MEQSAASTSSNLSLFCWNIANPSPERAAKQAPWLRKQPADILILTECKQSKGCIFLERYFQAYGYQAILSKPEENEYGVLIASRRKIAPSEFSAQVTYLSPRVLSVKLPYLSQELDLIGAYVPSRDTSPEKTERKKRFLSSLLASFENNPDSPYRIFCGDLNILEPDHVPHYSIFEDWEYDFYRSLPKYNLHDAFLHAHPQTQEHSWVGRMGDGYRYDHCFVSADLLPCIRNCYYLHEPRLEKLSDHSALILEVAEQPVETI